MTKRGRHVTANHPPEPSPPRRRTIRQWLVRRRGWLFALIGLLLLLSFNARWRMGPDSALYLQLGRNLAAGEGFTYHGRPHDHAYPGLPWLLAGLQQLFGDPVAPALILNLLCTVGILVLVYRMVGALQPRWVAVAAVLIVGVNFGLQRYTAEVLTDVPFLFAVCVVLYAWQQLGGSLRAAAAAGLAAMLAAGLAATVLLRPTGWIIAAALAWAALWSAIRQKRRAALIVLAVTLLIGACWLMLDPRGGLAGHYEQRTLRMFYQPQRITTNLTQNVPALLDEHMLDVLMGMQLAPGVNQLVALLIIVGGVLAGRGRPLWGTLWVLMLAVTLALAGTVPRYYLMVLPILAVGWIEVLRHTGRWIPRRHRNAWLTVGLLLVVLPNLGMDVKLIVEQRAVPFVAHYRHGAWLPYTQMAEAISAHVPADRRVLGPRPRVLTYLSGREVTNGQNTLDRLPEAAQYEKMIEMRIAYVILPTDQYRDQTPPNLSWRTLIEVEPDVENKIAASGWGLARLEPTSDGKRFVAKIVTTD